MSLFRRTTPLMSLSDMPDGVLVNELTRRLKAKDTRSHRASVLELKRTALAAHPVVIPELLQHDLAQE